MKKVLKFALLLVVSVLMMANSVFAAGGVVIPPDSNVNPLNVARAFALKTPDHYECYFGGSILVSNVFQPMSMQFTMAKDFGITKLVINGNAIALPEPIYGLPLGEAGLMRDVYLNVNAMTKSGEYAGNGYVQKIVVTKNDSLIVKLTPAEIKQELPADVAQYGNDIDLSIDNFPYGYGYGVDNGKFYAYLPPVGGKYSYVLRQRSTGAVIGSGTLEPFKPAVTPNDAYVGITYIGNVQGIALNQEAGLDDWVGINNINFDCQVPTEDGPVMGKVIFTDVGSGNLDIILNGEYEVFVQAASSEGDMPFLALQDISASGQGWHETRFVTTSGNVGKVVVTIIPKITNQERNVWGNFHRFYGVLQDGGRG